MEKLDYWLVYRTKTNKWRVFADESGTVILFTNREIAEETGRMLLQRGVASTAFSVIHARMVYSNIVEPLTQTRLPESDIWGIGEG